MHKPGQVREDDYGNLHFQFADGTCADADWVPVGELGDGQGGGFEEDSVYPLDSGLTTAELLRLADANAACGGAWRPIQNPV